MDTLKGLNPEVIVVLGTLWILREVFGFLTKLNKRQEPSAETKLVVDAIAKISQHIEAQTMIIRELVYDLKSLQKDMDRLGIEFERIRSKVD